MKTNVVNLQARFLFDKEQTAADKFLNAHDTKLTSLVSINIDDERLTTTIIIKWP